tara:strand:+ start:11103 stop:11600 length:498 start_codon:yes stop_codon:yes gene_type:complete
MDTKQKVIIEANNLSSKLKTELLEYLLKNQLQNTQNTNGYFFLLSNFSDEIITDIYDKIQYLKSFNEEEDDDDDELTSNVSEQIDKTESCTFKKQTIQNEYPINDAEKYISNFENLNNKHTKRSCHLKYSVAKKKYNKQTINEAKKVEDINDLNELSIEEYILKE